MIPRLAPVRLRRMPTGELILVALLITSCASSKPEPGGSAYDETGIASYYGHEFHGRKTASGEIYDENELTAAHRTLPFGTLVRVTSKENGKSVVLRITDRGPFVSGRIIDVSYRAAQELVFVREGLVEVRVQEIRTQW
jgi:rare lipoprotein A